MVDMSASSIKSKDSMLTLGARFDQLRQQDEKLAEELKVQQKRLEALEKTQVKQAPPSQVNLCCGCKFRVFRLGFERNGYRCWQARCQ